MRVGELSRRTGASVRSLRYYEERGLISASRSSSGQRHYDEATEGRVRLVRQLLDAGLGTAAILDVLPCMAEPSTRTSLLTARLVAERDHLSAEIAHRVAMRDALTALIQTTPVLE